MSHFTSADITRILPHRYPFLFVDRVEEFTPGQRIVAIKHFSADDEAVRGNAPGVKLVPTGVILELVTQVGAVLVMERPEMEGKIAMILHIISAGTIKPIEAGDTLRVEVAAVRIRAQFGELKGVVLRDGEPVAEGQMRFGIANKSDVIAPSRGPTSAP